MSFCPGCGAPLPEQARFCPACGIPVAAPVPVDPDGGPPAPEAPAPLSFSAPPWLTSDWTLAAVCAFGFLLALFAAGAFHGALMGFTALGGDGIGLGAIAGVYIPFVALGGDTVAVVNNGGNTVFVAGSALLLTWLAVPVLFGRRILRYGHARIPETAAARAFVVKLALVLGVGFGVAGGLAGTDDPERSLGDAGFGVAADVGAGEAGFWLVLLVLVLGAVSLLHRPDHPTGPGFGAWRQVRSWGLTWGRVVLWGGGAWLAVALAAGVGLTVAAIIVADGAEELVLAIEAAPAMVVNAGVAGAAVASGASVDTTAALVDLPFSVAEGDRSLSLFHFDFPPDEDSGPAPIYVFPLLLLAPGAVAATTWRALQASRPPGEQEGLRVAFAVAGGFVLAAWLGSSLAPLAVAAGARGDGTEILGSAVARPSVGGTVGLALVWALAASLATALTWLNRRKVSGERRP
ncbi:MAG: zinc ribbon domain-containing protein [Actinomycetota bacterium]|nr:zinc ribbon domain-containing protein [Actinomycetota bacterium]